MSFSNYKVIFRNWSGEKVYQFAGTGGESGGLTQIIYDKPVNKSGPHTVTIKGDTSVADDIHPDYMVDIHRRPQGSAVWVRDYIGLHRTWVWKADKAGNEIFTSHGFDLKSLLSRRIIASYVGSSESLKTGVSETVAKEYVLENAGSSAVVARQFPDFTVEADSAAGVPWEGDRARQNLLEVLQELAEDGGDFDIVYTEDGAGNFTGFEFRWYYPIIGTDRTAGTPGAVVFSTERNNMQIPISSYNRSSEINAVYVLGQGQGIARVVRTILAPSLIDDSPWNRMEATRQASNEGTTDGLDRVGAEWLLSNIPRQKMSFQILQSVGSVYGVDYFSGDIVTGIYKQQIDKRLANIRVNVTGNGELVSATLGDTTRIRI